MVGVKKHPFWIKELCKSNKSLIGMLTTNAKLLKSCYHIHKSRTRLCQKEWKQLETDQQLKQKGENHVKKALANLAAALGSIRKARATCYSQLQANNRRKRLSWWTHAPSKLKVSTKAAKFHSSSPLNHWSNLENVKQSNDFVANDCGTAFCFCVCTTQGHLAGLGRGGPDTRFPILNKLAPYGPQTTQSGLLT